MTTTINNYADLQKLLNALVSANSLTPGLAPHYAFWNDLTYKQFISGNVPNVGGGIYKILVVGNAAQSNIIQALSGTPGSAFDPNSGSIGQMPQTNPPYNSAIPLQTDVITALTNWINNGCPNKTTKVPKTPKPIKA
jgi:hypothetical protein